MKGALGCIIKLLVIVILLGVVFLIFLQLSGGSCVRTIDRSEPTIAAAPWEVTTPMKLYYAEKADVVKDAKGEVLSGTMTGWYERVNSKWVKRSGSITLEARLYGKIEVKRRK